MDKIQQSGDTKNLPNGKNFIANYELNNYSYDTFWVGRSYENQAELALLETIIKSVPNSQKQIMMDIGGGYGRLTQLIAPHFRKAILADYSMIELSHGQKLLQQKGNVEFLALNAYCIPLKDNALDFIMSVRLIHHLAEPQLFFDQIARVLKPGGTFILEAAHKRHIVAFIKALIKGKLSDFWSSRPVKIEHNPKDSQGIKAGQVSIVYAFGMKEIIEIANKSGLELVRTMPCSFFRHPLFKKIIPGSLLITFEKIMQKLTFLTITPSIFYEFKKNGTLDLSEESRTLIDIIQCPICGGEMKNENGKVFCSGHSFSQATQSIIDLRDPRPEEVVF